LSKLLTGLMEAERLRRQREGAGASPSAGTISAGRGVAEPAASGSFSTEAASRLAGERAAIESLELRIEEESAALAAAQQSEHEAAELAAAAASRAAKEAELARLAMDRAAAERCAADRAAALLQAQRAAEAAARSRVGAEEEAQQQTRRRVEQEAEVSRAAVQLKAEDAARAGRAPRDAMVSVPDQVTGSKTSAIAAQSAVDVAGVDQRNEGLPAAFGRLIAAVALSMTIGATAGFWLGGSAQAPATAPGSVWDAPIAMDRDATYLRLDHELRAVPIVMPRPLTGDP